MKKFSLYLSIILIGAPAAILAMELPVTRKEPVTRNYSLVTSCDQDQEKVNEEAQQAESELLYLKKLIAALSQKHETWESEKKAQSKQQEAHTRLTKLQDLGINHFLGINNCTKDHKKACEYFKLVERAQVPLFDKSLTWFYLGVFCKCGYVVPKDYASAKSYFRNINFAAIDKDLKDSVIRLLGEIAAEEEAKKNQDLGWDYYHGKIAGTPNYAKAREHFERVETALVTHFDFDKSLTWYHLGEIYFQGLEVSQDYKRAKSYLEKIEDPAVLGQAGKDYVSSCLAKIAQDEAAHNQAKQNQDLGCDYYYGKTAGTPNYTKAREHFELVERAEVPRFDKTLAWYYLGDIYFKGHEVSQDYKRAKLYFEKIKDPAVLGQAAKDYASSCLAEIAQDEAAHNQAKQNHNLGYDYFHGKTAGTPNYAKAREHFGLVERAEVPRFDKTFTWYYLGALYHNGFDVPQDYKRAKLYFEKIKDPAVLDQAGKDYVSSCLAKIAQDEAARQEALRFQDLAEKYYLGSQAEYKQHYAVSRAFLELVEKADIPGFDKSITYYFLGALYYFGNDVQRDYARAKSYLEKVVTINQAGREAITLWLRNIQVVWDKAAKDQSDGEKYYCKLNGYEQNFVQARTLFEQVDSADVPGFDKTKTWYYLGGIYFGGKGVNQDYQRAKLYFEKVVNSPSLDVACKEYVNNSLAKIKAAGA